jgi:ATP-binding cassette subfamily B (MDR/TAP) protein 1
MIIAKKSAFWSAVMVGAFKTFIFGYFCYAFYIATIFIEKKIGNPSKNYETYNTGDLLSVLISFNLGMMMLFGLTPNIQALMKAKTIGHVIFDVIDRVPEIRDNENCVDKFEIQNGINFRGVTFRYPTQPENVKNVLEEMSFTIKGGQTTAIVGPSGSGKSTIVQMLERFYSPKSGEIYLDDLNIKDIKLKKLRESIGYVS